MRSRWIAAPLNWLPGTGLLYAGRPVGAVVCLALILLIAHLMPAVAFHPLPRPLGGILLWAIPLGPLIGLPIAGWLAVRPSESEQTADGWSRGWYCFGFAVLTLILTNLNWTYGVASRIQAFRAPSASMEPAIKVGDFFYARLAKSGDKAPPPGSIVIFDSVEEENLKVTKRVAGVMGDTLEMKEGVFYRNRAEVREPFAIHSGPSGALDSGQVAQVGKWQRGRLLNPLDSLRLSLNTWGPFVVPADSFFVLGDNRDASYDSRYYGFVPVENYRGRPTVVYLSIDGAAKRIRWDRIGLRLDGIP